MKRVWLLLVTCLIIQACTANRDIRSISESRINRSLNDVTMSSTAMRVKSVGSCWYYDAYTRLSVPYDVGGTRFLDGKGPTSNGTFASAVYFLQPCSVFPLLYCEQQACLSVYTAHREDLIIEGLGYIENSTWWAVEPNDWSKGVISRNSDISPNWSSSGLCNSSIADSLFEVRYICVNGKDMFTKISQPSSLNEPCIFKLEVDSSVVCSYQAPSSSSASPAIESSSSSSSSAVGSVSSSSSSAVGSVSSSSSSSSNAGSTGHDSTGGSGGDDEVTVTWAVVTAVIAVVAMIFGVIAGACVALYTVRRQAAQANAVVQMDRTNHLVGAAGTYGERLL